MEAKSFEESELWYLVYSIIQAADTFHARGLRVGDIRPLNVFISPEGQVRVATQFTWPGEQSSYLKTAFEKEVTYLCTPSPTQRPRSSRTSATASWRSRPTSHSTSPSRSDSPASTPPRSPTPPPSTPPTTSSTTPSSRNGCWRWRRAATTASRWSCSSRGSARSRRAAAPPARNWPPGSPSTRHRSSTSRTSLSTNCQRSSAS